MPIQPHWGLITALMVVAGIMGGTVSATLRSTEPFSWKSWGTSVSCGLGAALLMPLFLQTISSKLLDNICGAEKEVPGLENLFVFFSFCLLAAISSRAFIQTLSDKVLKDIKEIKETQQEVAKQQAAVEAQAQEAQKQAQDVAETIKNQVQETFLLAKSVAKFGAGPTSSTSAREAADFPEILRGAVPEDPWKGQFGGKEEADGRRITANISRLGQDSEWYSVTLGVASTDPAEPLSDKVQFYLHPSFKNNKPVVDVTAEGIAAVTFATASAFTVGAIADGGRTFLELDLGQHAI